MGDAVSAAAVVRLHRTGETGGGVVGGGFVVGPDVIATCAHVVADAIGADPYGPAPTGPVTLDFPNAGTTGERREAVVHRWSPIAEDGTGDVALLRLTAAAPPDVHRPPLRRVEDLWDHEFRVLGFPTGRADGVWSRGRFRGGQSTRWFQLQGMPGSPQVEGGFSGCPVWDADSATVVGMTVAAVRGSEDGDDAATAYLIPIDQVLALDPTLLPCPYQGLRAFDEEHAATFFGRDAEIERLLEAVGRRPVVAVAGPSGAGKSSLVRAGLVPRLRAAGTTVVDVRARPGTDLTTVLSAPRPAGSVLVLDQFEEYAAVDPPGARSALEQLLLATDGEPVRAVLTMRWAALDDVVTPELLAPLEQGTVLIAPMSRGRLREAIVRPAERAPGLEFEPGLVDRILDDAGAEPGQLPLVASLLTDLWDRRDGSRLTVQGYEAAGGVAGAVATHAERVLAGLDADAVEHVRRLFLALARPDRDSRFVRQAVPLAELPAEQRQLVPVLTEARLLVVGPSGTGGDMTVEPAHQAVIDHWPRLQDWLAADRAFLGWRERVDAQRERWESENRAPSALLRGATLTEAADWLPDRAADLTAASTDYLRRSRDRQRFEVRRWRLVTAVLAVLGLVAASLAVLAVERRQTLAGHLATANAGALARESQTRAPTDVVLGAQLALAAWRADPDQPQARTALAAAAGSLGTADAELANLSPEPVTALAAAGDTAIAVAVPHPVLITGIGGPAPGRTELTDLGPDHQLALSPDGRQLADVPPDLSAVHIRDLDAPAQVRTFPSAAAQVGAPRFAPGGERLMWLEVDAAGTLSLAVWDLRSNARIPHGLGPLTPDLAAAWLTPDPNLVLVRDGGPAEPGVTTTTENSRLTLRSLADGSVQELPAGSSVVRGGAAVASCVPAGNDELELTVAPVGSSEATVHTGLRGIYCNHLLTAGGDFAISQKNSGDLRRDAVRVVDLRDGTAHDVDLVQGMVEDHPATSGLTAVTSIDVAGPQGSPVVLAAHHGAVLRFATRRNLDDADVGGLVREHVVSDDGRYRISYVDDGIAVHDDVTGALLARLPGVAPDTSLLSVGSELLVARPEQASWTLTGYELPSLRTITSFRLPTSADPLPTSPKPFMGQLVAVDQNTSPDGPLVSLSDGVLSALDPQTGQLLAPGTTLGAGRERLWYQIAPNMIARPAHDGHAVLVGPDGELQLWDATSGVLLRTIPTGYRPLEGLDRWVMPSFAIEPTGRQMAVLTPERTIEFWDLDTGARIGPVLPAPNAKRLGGFDADGHLVVVGTAQPYGTELRLVDLDGYREAGVVLREGNFDSLTLDGTAAKLGSTLYTNRSDLVPLTAAGWRDRICSVLDRPLRAEELALLPAGTGTSPPCAS